MKACEYCHLLKTTYNRAGSLEARNEVYKRFCRHKKMLHQNPPSKRRLKVARVAVKLAYKLYKTFKNVGVPSFVINRIPNEVRPYVVDILRFNGVAVRNPVSKSRR